MWNFILFSENSNGRPLFAIIIKDKITLIACARTVARAAPAAAILNIPTNTKSSKIFATQAIKTVISGVFASPSPLKIPPIKL